MLMPLRSSTLKTVDWRANDPELKLLAQWDWGAGLYQPMLYKFWTIFFKGDFKKYGKQVFNDYYAEVRSLVPPENLLEYKIDQGWEPLCEFLKVPVPPGKKFPHTNDSNGFVDRCRARNRAQTLNVLFRGVVIGGGLLAAVLSTNVIIHEFGFGLRFSDLVNRLRA
jgi:hypothetical protein